MSTLNTNIQEYITILKSTTNGRNLYHLFCNNLNYDPSFQKVFFMQNIVVQLEYCDDDFIEKLNKKIKTLEDFIEFLDEIAGAWIDKSPLDYEAMNEAFEEFEF